MDTNAIALASRLNLMHGFVLPRQMSVTSYWPALRCSLIDAARAIALCVACVALRYLFLPGAPPVAGYAFGSAFDFGPALGDAV